MPLQLPHRNKLQVPHPWRRGAKGTGQPGVGAKAQGIPTAQRASGLASAILINGHTRLECAGQSASHAAVEAPEPSPRAAGREPGDVIRAARGSGTMKMCGSQCVPQGRALGFSPQCVP